MLNIELSPMAAPHFEAGRRISDAVCQALLRSIHVHWQKLCGNATEWWNYCEIDGFNKKLIMGFENQLSCESAQWAASTKTVLQVL